MSKEQILRYIDVYDATPADKRKNKIAEIADGLMLPPWEVAETLKAAGCSVNLQWFNQLKRKAMQAGGGDPDERAAEAAAAAAPADASYLRKIIARQDRQLKEDAEKYKALEERAKDLANQLHDKDGELAKLDAALRAKDHELETLEKQLEEIDSPDEGSTRPYRELLQNHESAKRINAALRKEIEGQRAANAVLVEQIEELKVELYRMREEKEQLEERAKDLANQLHDKDGELAQADAKIRSLNAELFRLQEEKEQLEIYVNEADNDNIKLHEILDQYEAELDKPAERHFFGIEGGEDVADGDRRGDAAEESRCDHISADGETEAEEAPAVNAREYPVCRVPGGELDLSEVINDFCGGLHGVESYLCGRILEALWCWRLGNGADAMRVLQGLIQELIEMQLDEAEANA